MGDEQREHWDARAGAWDEHIGRVEELSDVFGRPARDRLALAPGERVLDVGCGPGTTAVALAEQVGPDGHVVAADISVGMVEAATRRAAAAGEPATSVVRAVVADGAGVEVGTGFDAVHSRFGLMFFPDPPDAFSRLAAALRPGGRLGACVWAELEANPWMFVPTFAALGPLGAEPTLPGPGEPGPFSLADADHLAALLGGAGFVDVTVERVEAARVIAADDADPTIAGLLAVGPLGEAWDAAPAPARTAAVAAVVEALAPFATDGGWSLPAAALVVGARTPG